MGLVLNSSPFWSMCTPAGMQFRRYHLKHRNYRLHGQPCREATLRRGECRLKDVQVNSMALLDSGSIVTCIFQFILYLLLLFFWGVCIWEKMRKKKGGEGDTYDCAHSNCEQSPGEPIRAQ
jgi:hypothetical protein